MRIKPLGAENEWALLVVTKKSNWDDVPKQKAKKEGATPRTLPCIIAMSIHECQTGSKVKHNYDYDLKQ